MTKALVLAGGGARGAYQVGMLRELVLKKDHDFEILRGVSVGALNAAFLAQASMDGGSSLDELKQAVKDLTTLWREEVRGNHSIYRSRAGFAGLAAGADSIYSVKPLRRLVKKFLKPARLKASGRDFKVGTVSLVSSRYREWDAQDEHFLERIIASASIPVVFPPVTFENDEDDVLVDGGVRNITPLSSAFRSERGATEIFVLLTSRLIPKDDGLDVLKRTVELLTDEIYLDDLRGAMQWNEVANSVADLEKAVTDAGAASAVKDAVTSVREALRKKRPVKLNVLAPRQWFGDDNDSTNFSPSLIDAAIKHGKQIAADPTKWVVAAD